MPRIIGSYNDLPGEVAEEDLTVLLTTIHTIFTRELMHYYDIFADQAGLCVYVAVDVYVLGV